MNDVILTPIHGKKTTWLVVFLITLRLALSCNLNIDDLKHLFIRFCIYNMNIFNLTLKDKMFI